MNRVVTLCLLAVPISTVSTPAQQIDIPGLVERVQQHYGSVQDFEGDFTQRYERRFLSRVIEESGTLAVKKPGRMRWEYVNPEEKLFVTDGTRSYFYIPQEKQVMVSHQPQGAMGMAEGSPFGLLVGESRVSDTFEPFPSDSPPKSGGVMLKLIPLKPQQEFEEVEIEVETATGRILRVVLTDFANNRTEFTFTDIRENVGLSETLFRFSVPPGVEVVVQSDAPGARH